MSEFSMLGLVFQKTDFWASIRPSHVRLFIIASPLSSSAIPVDTSLAHNYSLNKSFY